MGDISKKGWSSLAGNNVSSPSGGYGSNSDNYSGSGYQRSNSFGNPTSGNKDDWNWNEDVANSNNS